MKSVAGEQNVDTSTWTVDPLRAHGGTGANLLLRWNDVPGDARAIDVVVHLHGFKGLPPNLQMLRAVAARSGLDLSGRTRPTLAILPRGRRITPEEVRQRQARLDELAKRSGKKPDTARSDVYTFPAGRPTLTELEQMEVIANMIADVSSVKWREKVRTRKLWFVRGTGKVHGTFYDIKKDFGITDRAPDFGPGI